MDIHNYYTIRIAIYTLYVGNIADALSTLSNQLIDRSIAINQSINQSLEFFLLESITSGKVIHVCELTSYSLQSISTFCHIFKFLAIPTVDVYYLNNQILMLIAYEMASLRMGF